MIQYANWKAPKNVIALTTTRIGGFSKPPYDSNNLALHVGDNELDVYKNRQQLVETLNLSCEPAWLEQTHTNICVIPEQDNNRSADAAVTFTHDTPLVILTADCLPITLCNRQGTVIAAVHAGWRGLYSGIIENTFAKMNIQPSELLAWIGPAISQEHYEIGEEVFGSFTEKYPLTERAFIQVAPKKWLANLPAIAEVILNSLNINEVTQSNLCTYKLSNEYYSYRKMSQTGRIATLIWFNDQPQEP